MKKIITLFLIILILAGCNENKPEEITYRQISSEQAVEMMA